MWFNLIFQWNPVIMWGSWVLDSLWDCTLHVNITTCCSLWNKPVEKLNMRVPSWFHSCSIASLQWLPWPRPASLDVLLPCLGSQPQVQRLWLYTWRTVQPLAPVFWSDHCFNLFFGGEISFTKCLLIFYLSTIKKITFKQLMWLRLLLSNR